MNTPNFHAIEVKYLGTTNTVGPRVKMNSLRFNDSKTIPYDHNFNNTLDIAKDYLTKNGFVIVGQAETKDSYIILCDTFKPLKP